MIQEFQDFIRILTTNPASAIFLVLVILVLEIILSFDNAAVLATMVKDLPKHQQDKALKYGIVGAYVFRGIALVLVDSILDIWWLKPIGGAYLLYMCISHFIKKNAEDDKPGKETQDRFIYRYTIGLFGVFWSTVIAVEFMDIVFSIDNIFAVVAYSDNVILICFGVFIGILAMRFVARYFVTLMERYPGLETSAFIVIGILGIKLCCSLLVKYDKEAFEWIESENFDLIISCLTLSVFIFPLVWKKLKQ